MITSNGLMPWMFAMIITTSGLSQTIPTDHFFKYDGLRLRYIDEGTEEPVVLIHGFKTGKIIPELVQAGFAVYVYHLIGFGTRSFEESKVPNHQIGAMSDFGPII